MPTPDSHRARLRLACAGNDQREHVGLVWELLHGEKPTRLLGGIIPVEAPLVSKLVQGPEVN